MTIHHVIWNPSGTPSSSARRPSPSRLLEHTSEPPDNPEALSRDLVDVRKQLGELTKELGSLRSHVIPRPGNRSDPLTLGQPAAARAPGPMEALQQQFGAGRPRRESLDRAGGERFGLSEVQLELALIKRELADAKYLITQNIVDTRAYAAQIANLAGKIGETHRLLVQLTDAVRGRALQGLPQQPHPGEIFQAPRPEFDHAFAALDSQLQPPLNPREERLPPPSAGPGYAGLGLQPLRPLQPLQPLQPDMISEKKQGPSARSSAQLHSSQEHPRPAVHTHYQTLTIASANSATKVRLSRQQYDMCCNTWTAGKWGLATVDPLLRPAVGEIWLGQERAVSGPGKPINISRQQLDQLQDTMNKPEWKNAHIGKPVSAQQQ